MIAKSPFSPSARVEGRVWASMAMAIGLLVTVAALWLFQSDTLAAPAQRPAERPAPRPGMTAPFGEPVGRLRTRPVWPDSASCAVWSASDREHRYTFAKLINGHHADTLEEAVQVEAGDVLTFTYVVTNTGDFYIVLDALTDDVFGDLTAHCDLLDRVEIAVGESVSCDFLSEAERAQEGKRNTATAFVWCLEEQSAAAWYRTAPPTAITVLDFQAHSVEGSAVRLTWETAAEPGRRARSAGVPSLSCCAPNGAFGSGGRGGCPPLGSLARHTATPTPCPATASGPTGSWRSTRPALRQRSAGPSE